MEDFMDALGNALSLAILIVVAMYHPAELLIITLAFLAFFLIVNQD